MVDHMKLYSCGKHLIPGEGWLFYIESERFIKRAPGSRNDMSCGKDNHLLIEEKDNPTTIWLCDACRERIGVESGELW
jgi:hypothetical protein